MTDRKHIDYPKRFTVTAVTRVKTGTDPYGEPIFTETRTDHPAVGWAQPLDTVVTTAVEQGREVHDLDLYADRGVLQLQDAVEVSGTRYRVVGVRDYDNGPWATTGLSVYELEVIK
ncbi:hypothetical protein [Corynebacterium variabile]|uniref:hypothetical protein n=1 Tax=Corynebacterium variabile TaxID=1727 RepID=UPI003FCF90F1